MDHAASLPKRKRKKRKKRRLPRFSSRSLHGRAHRRQRQWLGSGFPGDVPFLSVFLFVVDRPEMPCIMAGMHLALCFPSSLAGP